MMVHVEDHPVHYFSGKCKLVKMTETSVIDEEHNVYHRMKPHCFCCEREIWLKVTSLAYKASITLDFSEKPQKRNINICVPCHEKISGKLQLRNLKYKFCHE